MAVMIRYNLFPSVDSHHATPYPLVRFPDPTPIPPLEPNIQRAYTLFALQSR